MTELLYLRDAHLRTCEAVVTGVDDHRVCLDRTVFYPTGGGQPHDTGLLGGAPVVSVDKVGGEVWHTLAADSEVPQVGDVVSVEIDWDRRHQLMRTHTAMHILCGVMWNRYRVPVTGGSMEPLAGRLDFEFREVPDGFREDLAAALDAEVLADRPVRVDFVPRCEAVLDESLIRTKVNLVPESVHEIRIVDIVGLDRQADGGTHVTSTAEVGEIEITRVESKGKGFRRVRIRVTDRVGQREP